MCIKYQGWRQQHIGHTNITMHTNTQSAKQDRPRAQEKKRMDLIPNTKQGEA